MLSSIAECGPPQYLEEAPVISNGASLLRALLGYVRGPLAVSLLAGSGTMFLAALVPAYIGEIIDRLTSPQAKVDELIFKCLILAAIVAGGAVVGIVQERCDVKIRLDASLRSLTWVSAKASQPGSRAANAGTSSVVSVGVGDIAPIGSGIAALSRGMGGLTAVLVVAVVMLTMSWKLGLLVFLGGALLICLNDVILRPYRKAQGAVREKQDELTEIALDTTSGLHVIKGLGAAEHFSRRYVQKSQAVRSTATHMARTEGLIVGVRSLASGILGAIVVGLGAQLALSGEITIGQLIAAYGYAVFLTTPIRWLLNTTQSWALAKVSAGRMAAYLSCPSESIDSSTADRLEPDPELDAECVVLSHEGEYVVVASNDPIDWAVFAQRMGSCRRDETKAFRAISSDDYLFSGRLSDVLTSGIQLSEGSLMRAIETTLLSQVIDALPDGLEHEMAAGGSDFSGGEQQRLRLARALLANPSTLVLVEPTNALDATSEMEIARRLRLHRSGKSTIVLTASTPHLVEADTVVFLIDGKIAASGPHSSLLQNPDYRAMVHRMELQA